MINMPEIKLGIVAVSRDCFPMTLSENRRKAVVAAYDGEIYECPTVVESEKDMMKALAEVNEAGCDALVVYLGNFGPETAETLLVKYFDGPCMIVAAAEETGDNLVGGKMGGMDDSEQIQVDLTKVPQGIERIVFVVNIYDCVKRKQHFGMVENAYIRIVDQGSQETIASYNLTEDYSGKTSMIVGEIYHKDGAWKFNAVGQPGYDPGLSEIVAKYR